MSPVPITSPVLLAAVGAVLLAAATGHLLSRGSLARGLRTHGVLPEALRRPVALLLPLVEVVLGGALVASALGAGGVPLARSAGAGAALLAAGFTAYLWVVLRRTGGDPVPCACGLGEAPLSRSGVLRAGLLAAFAAVGALTAAGWSATAVPGVEVAVAAGAALTLALAVALLPAARAVPEDLVLTGGAR